MNEKQLYNFKYDIYKTESGYKVVEAINNNLNMIIFLRVDDFDECEKFYIVNNKFKIKEYSVPFNKKAYKKYCNVYEQMKVLLFLAGNAANVNPSENYINAFKHDYGRSTGYFQTSSASSYSNWSLPQFSNISWGHYMDIDMYNDIYKPSYENLEYSFLDIFSENYYENKHFFPGWFNHVEGNKNGAEDYTILQRMKYDIDTKKIEFTFEETSENDELDGDSNDASHGKYYFGNKANCRS